MTANEKNVMLSCLSLANLNRGLTTYYDVNEEVYEGFITNEAPVKSVINQLKREGKKLDQIIVISSDSTREKPLENGRKSLEENFAAGRMKSFMEYVHREECNRGVDISEYTHLKMWKHSIENYLMEADNRAFYCDAQPEISVVEIADDTKDLDVVKAAINALGYMNTKNGCKTNLYIDYNGGQRYIAFMLLNIAKLSEFRNTKVKSVLAMNFEKKKDDMVPIENMTGIFESDRLVSGINEFVNYGRVKILKNFFADCSSPKIENCIELMEKFAENMQLCDVSGIMSMRRPLSTALKEFTEQKDNGATNLYEIFFQHVADDIYSAYEDLFEKDIPSVIRWCLNKDFVQQALTFAVERTPEYFWDSGLFRPSVQEMEEYNRFWTACQECLKEGTKDYSRINSILKVSDAGDNIRNEVKKMLKEFNNYKGFEKKYNWFTKYLQHSWSTIGRVAVSYHTPGNEPLYTKHPGDKKEKVGYLGLRATTCTSDENIREIMRLYETLKADRNAANHASKDNRRSYSEICSDLKKFADCIEVCD